MALDLAELRYWQKSGVNQTSWINSIGRNYSFSATDRDNVSVSFHRRSEIIPYDIINWCSKVARLGKFTTLGALKLRLRHLILQYSRNGSRSKVNERNGKDGGSERERWERGKKERKERETGETEKDREKREGKGKREERRKVSREKRQRVKSLARVQADCVVHWMVFV